jgi:hypothetical protein
MNFHDLQPWHYAVAGCGVLLLLAIILYFIPGGRINVSGSAACGLVSLVVGFGIGILTMFAFGFHWEGEPTPKAAAGGGGGGGNPMARMGGMGGGGGGGKGEGGGKKGEGKKGESKKDGTENKGKDSDSKKSAAQKQAAENGAEGSGSGRGGPGGGPRTPPKDRLVSLVNKLDLLTSQGPAVKLTDDQKAKIREKLSGLADKEEITDEDAQKTLEDILEIVEGDRKSLELAGFQYPGAGGDFPRPIPNPFKYKANADHLKTLQDRLGTGK